MARFIDASPPPSRHVETLRKVGYGFTAAIGDLLDNSIAAKSSKIDIVFSMDNEIPYLTIEDNGFGMSRRDLVANMTISCKDPNLEREGGDLGRFGSGLKTASFSQARRLTVFSHTKDSPVSAARWDIDDIVERNEWCLQVLDESDISKTYYKLFAEKTESGTIVRWDKITAVVDDIHTPPVETQIAGLAKELHKYIGLYFHRFLSGVGKCTITINGRKVRCIDPFMKDIPGYQEGPATGIRSKAGRITIKTHILPPFNMMTRDQIIEYGGTAAITEKQGLYIYREKRLIVEGGWQGLTRLSKLAGLARIQIDMPSALDLEWATDVKKSTLTLPPKIKSILKRLISSPIKKSRGVYAYKGAKEAENDYWLVLENEREKFVTYEADPSNHALKSIMTLLDGEGKGLLANYLSKLCSSIPLAHIFSVMSDRPKDIHQDNLEEIDSIEAWLERVNQSEN